MLTDTKQTRSSEKSGIDRIFGPISHLSSRVESSERTFCRIETSRGRSGREASRRKGTRSQERGCFYIVSLNGSLTLLKMKIASVSKTRPKYRTTLQARVRHLLAQTPTLAAAWVVLLPLLDAMLRVARHSLMCLAVIKLNSTSFREQH